MTDVERRLAYNHLALYLIKDGRLDEAQEYERRRRVKSQALAPAIRFVTPAKWKRWANLIKQDKKASLSVARQLFGANHFPLVKHHNRAEAALISLYGEEELT